MNFIRLSTRLHTDVYEAYRGLIKTAKIEKWYDQALPKVIGDPYHKIIWQFDARELKDVVLEFYLMKCAVKTEYCTEVNILVRFDAPMDSTDSIYMTVHESCSRIIESLRKYYNKDWIIQDKDLTAGIFRQSL